jgi:signal transduction histidine kinase
VLERLTIRWRLAAISSLLTFCILSVFSLVVGELTTRRIRSDFSNQLVAASDNLTQRLDLRINDSKVVTTDPPLDAVAAPGNVIRVLVEGFNKVAATKNAPDLGPPHLGTSTSRGYLVSTRTAELHDKNTGLRIATVYIQYARKLSDLQATIRRVRLFLIFGILGGTAAALAGGLMLARRAMKPIALLTATSREITQTRDPNRRVPIPRADDEVAELARTLQQMLQGLESSRAENAAMPLRQRQFVADASHELRTPLTSVLANLELLAETLHGEEEDAARSALRSSQRMRRLVADLLLLARADASGPVTHVPTDVGAVVVDAAGELGPVAQDHELRVDVEPDAIVSGARDELTRLSLNLMENAVKHTPPGTAVTAAVHRVGSQIVLSVEDDGPGVADEVKERLFERFVRGGGDRSGSFGLGLSIVSAVTESHGGSVAYETPASGHGARFVVRLPATPVTAQTPDAAGVV